VLPQYFPLAVQIFTAQTYNYCNSFSYSIAYRPEMLKKAYFKLWTRDTKPKDSRKSFQKENITLYALKLN